MTVAVLAEKPSVAKDIAKVLGARKREYGCYKGNSYVVTWAVGHLVTLAEPHDINPSWKSWRRENLPMIPATWKLSVLDQTRPQFEIVKNILNSNETKEIICATDAGREGELIFRYIYEASGCKKTVRRLWISSLTNEAILNGFKSLKQGNDYNLLADAATGRSRADWLVGLNFSRAYSLIQGQGISVGRVQTPTLAMLVEKERVIRDFKPEKYVEIHGAFTPSHELIKNRSKDEISNYRGTWFESTPETLIETSQIKKEGDKKSARLPADGITANEIVKRCRNGKAVIEYVNAKTKSMLPLLLYDLTELQRHANRLYGFSAKKTLDLAQNLYEGKKLISYPRTDSRYLSKDVIPTIGKILKAIVNPYKAHLPVEMDPSCLGSRFVNDSKVTDHHAIIPTAVSPEKVSLSPDEYKIHDLICRRFLSCWLENHIIRTTTVVTVINSNTLDSEAVSYIDRFHTSGTSVEQTGWKVLDIRIDKKKNGKKGKQNKDSEQKLPPGLHKDQPLESFDIETIQKQTKPPNRFTDATLLTAMETAGKTLDDKELSDAMKERGLGTPATRAAIIETLVKREFIVRKGKFYTVTDKGINLINAVHPHVKSAEMTGDWEHKLKKIEKGKGDLNGFMKEIEDYVIMVIQAVLNNGQQVKQLVPPEPLNLQNVSPKHSISHSGNLETLLKEAFGFDKFRPFQHKICQSVVDEKNVLLVMPTGAGKSLCYQLPGIARGGTTLVVSPLIALMEDQVIKLQEMGFAAERIHSGRTRAISRQVCLEYLQGRLDYLFIAPERLSVPGFPEMLAKRKPVLVAVDEAHCISQWGHDFRPDYRLLGERLPLLKPANVIAMTATATPRVQDDIVQQLALYEPQYHIHGFRRTNIAIELVELLPSERPDAAVSFLKDSKRRPAIIYAPTRKKAESFAQTMKNEFSVQVYHAGLTPKKRDEVQAAFISEDIEVIVATIAFGMGIDKPNIRTVIHMAMPGSLENYYQEIGRAGRDGKPSRAILYHSYGDRHVHLFFHEKNYPDEKILKNIYSRLTEKKAPKEKVLAEMGLDEEAFDMALEKLWIHGGALVDPDERIRKGHNKWEQPYKKQKLHRLAQIEEMTRFAESFSCRMLYLINHFGDREDNGAPCGLCDFCAPDKAIATLIHSPNNHEQRIIAELLNIIGKKGSMGSGRLFTDSCKDKRVTRREFEYILNSLAGIDLIHVFDASFEKDNKTIRYRRVEVTREGRCFEHSKIDTIKIKGFVPEFGSSRSAVKKQRKKSTGIKVKRRVAPKKLDKPINPDARIRASLVEWRLKEAKRRRIPAFRILSNKTLDRLASDRPKDQESLLEVKGVGPALANKFGDKILEIISGN